MHSLPVIDSGHNLHHLGESSLHTHDPFKPDNPCHILETDLGLDNEESLSHQAFIRKVQLQYFDSLEDSTDEDWSYIPTGIITHKVSHTP